MGFTPKDHVQDSFYTPSPEFILWMPNHPISISKNDFLSDWNANINMIFIIATIVNNLFYLLISIFPDSSANIGNKLISLVFCLKLFLTDHQKWKIHFYSLLFHHQVLWI